MPAGGQCSDCCLPCNAGLGDKRRNPREAAAAAAQRRAAADGSSLEKEQGTGVPVKQLAVAAATVLVLWGIASLANGIRGPERDKAKSRRGKQQQAQKKAARSKLPWQRN